MLFLFIIRFCITLCLVWKAQKSNTNISKVQLQIFWSLSHLKSNSRPMSEQLTIVCLNCNCLNFSLIGILTFVSEEHKRQKWKYIVCLQNELYNEQSFSFFTNLPSNSFGLLTFKNIAIVHHSSMVSKLLVFTDHLLKF